MSGRPPSGTSAFGYPIRRERPPARTTAKGLPSEGIPSGPPPEGPPPEGARRRRSRQRHLHLAGLPSRPREREPDAARRWGGPPSPRSRTAASCRRGGRRRPRAPRRGRRCPPWPPGSPAPLPSRTARRGACARPARRSSGSRTSRRSRPASGPGAARASTRRARSIPIAKFWPSSARPSEPVVRAAALTPITRPSRSTSGPARVARVQRGVGLDRVLVGGHVGGGVAERRAGGGHDAAGGGDRVARRRVRRRSRARPRSRPARRSSRCPAARSRARRRPPPAAARGPRTARAATTAASPPRRRGSARPR